VVADELPGEVRRFLTEYVDSIEALSILLALIDADSRWWDAHAMAAQSGSSAADARRVLEAFASRNLLDIRISDDVRYRLRPGTPDLEDLLHQVAAIYRTSPRTLFQWVAGRPRRSVADFSDAFRIRKQ
jgi:hypothetical protein